MKGEVWGKNRAARKRFTARLAGAVATQRLIRYQPRWAALADKLRAVGKPGSLTAAAVANRWLRWLYYQMQPQSI